MKTHKRVIALSVAFAFIVLLQVSAMPLGAGPTPDRSESTVTTPEQGPSYIEEEGTSSSSAKKSIVPVVLIGLGVAALAAVLVLVVFKTKYDIVGTWTVHTEYDGLDDAYNLPVVFSGDKKSGTTVDNYWYGTGTYSIDGKKITFTLRWSNGNTSTFTGEFDGKDRASGRFHESNDFDGDWTAVRGASSAGLPQMKKTTSNAGPGR